MVINAKRDRIRELNDSFRSSFEGGRIVMTVGVNSLRSEVREEAIRMVATYANFSNENDPYGEHDFGDFEIAGYKFFWKIDNYNQTLTGGSPDPADPAQTCRVLTIMLAEEY